MNTDRIKEIQSKTAYPNSVSVAQALLQVWNECEQSPEKIDRAKEAYDRELTKISPTEKDIIILKGDWSHDEIQNLAGVANGKGINSIIVVIPDDKALETMPINDFYYLLKQVEKKKGIIPDPDEVCGD